MKILVTGGSGVVGTAAVQLLQSAGHEVTLAGRRPAGGQIVWSMGHEPPPPALRQSWDVVVHLAASTRWTMSTTEAMSANVAPTAAVLQVATGAHLVHVSTAYVGGERTTHAYEDPVFEGFRNGYEWSKAKCEELVLDRHDGALTIVRPPLVLGSSVDGTIARFSGPYTLLQSLTSGLAAAVVGEPDGFAEIAPVDLVAERIHAAASGTPPAFPLTDVIAAGPRCLQLAEMLQLSCATINTWRAERQLEPIQVPPIVPADAWHRFYLPLSREYLSPVQSEAVRLLGMFESYTSMSRPFTPTTPVFDPAAVLIRSIEHWMAVKPRLVSRTPAPWTQTRAS